MIPQYAKSTNAVVLEVVRRNTEGINEWRERALAFATTHGAPESGFYPSTFAGRYSIYAIETDDAPTTGRWRRMRQGWAPYKNNPLSTEMAAIRFDRTPIPGLPSLVYSDYEPDGRRWLMTPAPFIHDGAAWVGFDRPPVEVDGRDGGFGPQWTECLASQYHAAREAVTR